MFCKVTAMFTVLSVLSGLSASTKTEESLYKDKIESASKEIQSSVLKKDSGDLSKRVSSVYVGDLCCGTVMEDGSLYMWGENFQGCLGDGTLEDQLRPVKVLDNVQQFETYNGHSGAVAEDGSLYMWGRNIEGQVGADTDAEYLKEPINVLDHVQSISLGAWSSGAVTDDGSLYVWGTNRDGQLGDGTVGGEQRKPVKILENVYTINFHDLFAGAVTKDGSLYMWGHHDGDMVESSRGEPVKMLDHVFKYMHNDNRVSEYGALTEDGSLYIWEDQYGIIDIPKKVLENVQDFSMGSLHFGAVTKDGSLYMWGNNRAGQLGDGTRKDQSKPIKIMSDVQSVSLTHMSSAVIKKDGSLYMWGDNSFGQLGDGTTKDQSKPVKIMENVQSVSLNLARSGAITKDGNLYMWGNNKNGQLGDGTKKNRKNPVRISFTDKASQTITYQSSRIKKKKVTYGSVFSLNAKTSGKGRLTYKSSASNILTVDSQGKVIVKGYGPVSIKIKASGGKEYKAAVRTLKLIAVPQQGKITKAEWQKSGVRFQWNPEKTADGYEYAIAYNKKFSGQSRKKTQKTGLLLTKYKTGTKRMSIKVRTYKKVGRKTYYGYWSKPWSVKLQKKKTVQSTYTIAS